jgi:hypothetical protein
MPKPLPRRARREPDSGPFGLRRWLLTGKRNRWFYLDRQDEPFEVWQLHGPDVVEHVANKLDGSGNLQIGGKSVKRGARNTAAWRQRQRTGKIVLRLEVDEASLTVGLVDAGLLDPLVADDKHAITAAAQQALVRFCEEGGERTPPEEKIRDTIKARLLIVALKKALLHATRRARRHSETHRRPSQRRSRPR